MPSTRTRKAALSPAFWVRSKPLLALEGQSLPPTAIERGMAAKEGDNDAEHKRTRLQGQRP